MRNRPNWLIPIEHAADIGMNVSAATLEELYERSAWGMFFELTDLDKVSPRESRKIEIQAQGYEALLVEWLSELNFIHTVERYLFSKFDVTEVSAQFLKATVFGEKFEPSRHSIQNEIKAVTYHLLKVEHCSMEGWRADVLFDV
ncbi:MAG: archease [Limisphaerales bacterium]|nr:archease [Verrucomicrobiota bacterium]